jgi:hypothetical protein
MDFLDVLNDTLFRLGLQYVMHNLSSEATLQLLPGTDLKTFWSASLQSIWSSFCDLNVGRRKHQSAKLEHDADGRHDLFLSSFPNTDIIGS